MTAPVVLITGASSGLGRATADLLAASGMRVFGTSRAPSAGSSLPYTMLPLDVRSDESAQSCVQAALDQAGRIDVLINNAGYELSGALEEASLEQAQALFETNFFGVARMVNAVLPQMRRQSRGTIINISSLVGLGASPFAGFYSASKHAVEGYSAALRQEVKRFGVNVVALAPGGFQSALGRAGQAPERSIPAYDAMRRRATAVFDNAIDAGADPRDIARLILRIIRRRSPRARYLFGADTWAFLLSQRLLPGPLAEAIVRLTYRLDNQPIREGIVLAMLHLVGAWKGTTNRERMNE